MKKVKLKRIIDDWMGCFFFKKKTNIDNKYTSVCILVWQIQAASNHEQISYVAVQMIL